jgi:hypothetical protein
MKPHATETKKAFLSGCVFLIFLGSLALGAAQPKIKFKEETWNFGKVKQGETLAHEFVFTNSGDATLIIQKVSTSCGCTAALASEDKIAPGKEGKIEIKFDTRGYGGTVSKLIFVESNDLNEARKQLQVSADIETPPAAKIDIAPFNFDAGLSVEGEEIKANLKIMNKGELELRAEFNHRNATYFVGGKPAPSPLKVAAGKEVVVEVRIPTQARVGVIREYVLVKSNDPMRSTLSLYVSGYIITKEQLKELFTKHKDILRPGN